MRSVGFVFIFANEKYFLRPFMEYWLLSVLQVQSVYVVRNLRNVWACTDEMRKKINSTNNLTFDVIKTIMITVSIIIHCLNIYCTLKLAEVVNN